MDQAEQEQLRAEIQKYFGEFGTYACVVIFKEVMRLGGLSPLLDAAGLLDPGYEEDRFIALRNYVRRHGLDTLEHKLELKRVAAMARDRGQATGKPRTPVPKAGDSSSENAGFTPLSEMPTPIDVPHKEPAAHPPPPPAPEPPPPPAVKREVPPHRETPAAPPEHHEVRAAKIPGLKTPSRYHSGQGIKRVRMEMPKRPATPPPTYSDSRDDEYVPAARRETPKPIKESPEPPSPMDSVPKEETPKAETSNNNGEWDGVERRSGRDRRKDNERRRNVNLIMKNRRYGGDRRKGKERRKNWPPKD